MLEKHSIQIAGHKTSISLEPTFWRHIKRMASEKEMTLTSFIAQIDKGRGSDNLSSALRVAVLKDLED